MTDRYDDLMARRAALVDECYRRCQAIRDRIVRTAPLGSVSWSSSGPVLSPDGRLSVEVEERDEHHRRRDYWLWSEVDGTIHEMAAPADAEEGVVFSPDPRISKGRPEPGFRELSDLASRHLGRPVAEDWLSFVTPAVRLVHARAGDPVIAQLGGLPALPINSWPVWEGQGPLSHVLSIDCASLTRLLPGWDLPDSGRLAFFYFDGHYANYEGTGTVGVWDPATQDGARVLWLHPEDSTPAHLTHVATPAPPGLTAFPAVALTAVPALTWPAREHPELARIWEASGLAGPEPGMLLPPVEALYQTLDGTWSAVAKHQVGGHPQPVQGPVEPDADRIERAMRGAGATSAGDDGPGADGHARGWRLLAQIDSDDDAKMMWGDVGRLYFMIRPDDIRGRRFGQARFTWQCG